MKAKKILALLLAVAMVLGHNHPSGNTKPSKEDDRITKQIARRLSNKAHHKR